MSQVRPAAHAMLGAPMTPFPHDSPSFAPPPAAPEPLGAGEAGPAAPDDAGLVVVDVVLDGAPSVVGAAGGGLEPQPKRKEAIPRGASRTTFMRPRYHGGARGQPATRPHSGAASL